MPELTTLAVLVGLLLSAIAGEALVYRDTLHLQINVPTALQEKGFNESVAEEVFSSEAARIIRGESIIPAPAMRIHSQPNLLSAIVEPLRLDNAVAALQSQFGVDRLGVVAAIMQGEGKPDRDEAPSPKPAGASAQSLQILLVVSQPYGDPVQARLAEEDGDPVTLVRRAAQWTMERVAPYRVALSHFRSGTEGSAEGFARARQTVARALARPWQPEQASERALLTSLRGLIDLADNDLAGARAAYRAAEAVPDVLPAVRAELALNRAVVALALKQPAQAAELLKQTEPEAATSSELPEVPVDRRLVEGLVAWGNGDLATAERIFRSITVQAPLNEAGHRYRGQVLAARGDHDGASKALEAAAAVHVADQPPQPLAVALFWVDPVAGGLTRRF
jgi:tetratricopeptide (TPR) repeat protein